MHNTKNDAEPMTITPKMEYCRKIADKNLLRIVSERVSGIYGVVLFVALVKDGKIIDYKDPPEEGWAKLKPEQHAVAISYKDDEGDEEFKTKTAATVQAFLAKLCLPIRVQDASNSTILSEGEPTASKPVNS